MKNTIVTLLIGFSISNLCFSQDSPSDFWNNRCEFITDGLGKSKGVKVRLSIPCKWKMKDSNFPNTIKRFEYFLEQDEVSIVSNIVIMPPLDNLTEAAIKRNFTIENEKKSLDSNEVLLSIRKTKIDNLDVIEKITKRPLITPAITLETYSITYLFFYKKQPIHLYYGLATENNDRCKIYFEKYKLLFQGLASFTVILNKLD